MDEQYDSYTKNTNLPSDFSVLEHEKFDPNVCDEFIVIYNYI